MSWWTKIRDNVVKPAAKVFLSANPATAALGGLINNGRKVSKGTDMAIDVVSAINPQVAEVIRTIKGGVQLGSKPVEIAAKTAADYNYNQMYGGNTPEKAAKRLAQKDSYKSSQFQDRGSRSLPDQDKRAQGSRKSNKKSKGGF